MEHLAISKEQQSQIDREVLIKNAIVSAKKKVNKRRPETRAAIEIHQEEKRLMKMFTLELEC